MIRRRLSALFAVLGSVAVIGQFEGNLNGLHPLSPEINVLKVHTTHYTLHTTHYTLHTTHCTLHTTHYTLHTTHYTLQFEGNLNGLHPLSPEINVLKVRVVHLERSTCESGPLRAVHLSRH